jgi:hypothetical protein
LKKIWTGENTFLSPRTKFDTGLNENRTSHRPVIIFPNIMRRA